MTADQSTREPTREELLDALRMCAFKLKIEYDRQQPNAEPYECWAECERAWDLLELEETRA